MDNNEILENEVVMDDEAMTDSFEDFESEETDFGRGGSNAAGIGIAIAGTAAAIAGGVALYKKFGKKHVDNFKAKVKAKMDEKARAKKVEAIVIDDGKKH